MRASKARSSDIALCRLSVILILPRAEHERERLEVDALVPAEVVVAPDRAPPTNATPVLVSSSGYRVEGLKLDDVLQALSEPSTTPV